MVLILRPRRQPLSFARRMSLATRFLPQRMPMALSSACTLGAPYVARLFRWIISIFSKSTASKRNLSDGGLFFQA